MERKSRDHIPQDDREKMEYLEKMMDTAGLKGEERNGFLTGLVRGLLAANEHRRYLESTNRLRQAKPIGEEDLVRRVEQQLATPEFPMQLAAERSKRDSTAFVEFYIHWSIIDYLQPGNTDTNT